MYRREIVAQIGIAGSSRRPKSVKYLKTKEKVLETMIELAYNIELARYPGFRSLPPLLYRSKICVS